jgi:hypothetical protein
LPSAPSPREALGICITDYGIGKTGGLSVELGIEPPNRLADLVLFLHAHRDSFASVQHRSMIPTPEGFSNFMQRGFGVTPSQIHRHLARECNIRGAPFTGHIRESNIKLFGHLLLNLIDGNRLLGFFSQNIPKKLFYRLSGTLSAIQGLVRGNPHQGALQTSNIGSDMLCEKSQNVLAKLHMKFLGFFPENRHASLDIRRLHFGC